MRQFYRLIEKGAPLEHQLSWTHYKLLIPLKNIDTIKYYISQIKIRNFSKRQLEVAIRNNEYERLPLERKEEMVAKAYSNITEFVKNPILIKNVTNETIISEKVLQKLILEDIENFMHELGNSFCFIGSEYKIKLGDTYNYIDLLLYNIEYNCYVVIELKVTELKKEHIGQIQVYMNYIDNNLKKPYQDKTIGIIICKKDNKYIIE